ncbi:MAG: type II toxin-antitoxin system VapC family toxin [Rhodospirillaceae bacterium]|nr:type II toxin-antitoxin system VapC family toxin [Rhodospirillaceae bacterium]
MTTYLIDTCTAIWIANGDPIREPAASTLQQIHEETDGLAVSPMTAWEIAMLESKGKIAEMPPAVLIASCRLPGSPPADPVDRILIATARTFGFTLVTRDRHVLDYGGEGHVNVMGC